MSDQDAETLVFDAWTPTSGWGAPGSSWEPEGTLFVPEGVEPASCPFCGRDDCLEKSGSIRVDDVDGDDFKFDLSDEVFRERLVDNLADGERGSDE